MNDNEKNFGPLVYYSPESDISESDLYVSAISQEHGTVQGIPSDEQVWVCPIHSCLTANLHSHYFTIDGEIIEKRILS